jgi:hypothetical protein
MVFKIFEALLMEKIKYKFLLAFSNPLQRQFYPGYAYRKPPVILRIAQQPAMIRTLE